MNQHSSRDAVTEWRCCGLSMDEDEARSVRTNAPEDQSSESHESKEAVQPENVAADVAKTKPSLPRTFFDDKERQKTQSRRLSDNKLILEKVIKKSTVQIPSLKTLSKKNAAVAAARSKEVSARASQKKAGAGIEFIPTQHAERLNAVKKAMHTEDSHIYTRTKVTTWSSAVKLAEGYVTSFKHVNA